MAPKKDLGTLQCCAEYRAWFAVCLQRLPNGDRLEQAFNKQFPGHKLTDPFRSHVTRVQNCKEDVRSQLLDLAKGFSWYKDPPQEGESGYKQMERLERLREARKRMNQKEFQGAIGSMNPDAGAAAGSEVSPSSSLEQTMAEGASASMESTVSVSGPSRKVHSGGSDSPMSLSSSSSNPGRTHTMPINDDEPDNGDSGPQETEPAKATLAGESTALQREN